MASQPRSIGTNILASARFTRSATCFPAFCSTLRSCSTFHREHHIARLHAGRCRRTRGVFHRQSFIGGAQREAELPGIGRGFPGGSDLLVFARHGADLDVQHLLLAVAPYTYLGALPGSGIRHQRGKRGRLVDRGRIPAEDDVARLDAGFGRGPVFVDRAHQRAFRPGQAEGLREALVHRLHRHADAPARHLAVRLQLVFYVHGDVDGDSERKAHVAAGAAVDLRVDADHVAVHVEQRPAGIPRIDRDVGLDERHIAVARERARLG
jgi:hypothetical protein